MFTDSAKVLHKQANRREVLIFWQLRILAAYWLLTPRSSQNNQLPLRLCSRAKLVPREGKQTGHAFSAKELSLYWLLNEMDNQNLEFFQSWL